MQKMRSLPLPTETVEAIRQAFYNSRKSRRQIATENGFPYTSFYNWMAGFSSADCKGSDQFRRAINLYLNVNIEV